MLFVSESYAIFIFTIISSSLLIPSVIHRLYFTTLMSSTSIWFIFMNSVICIVASCFQEAMIRRMKKKFGIISLVLFITAVPLTFFNILFSDPTPYFTLCAFACFSVEECKTIDQDLGNYTSLSFVFGLQFLLSAEVLAIRFNFLFLVFTNPEIKTMVKEENEKYNGKPRGNKDDGSEADETKYPNILSQCKADDKEINLPLDPEMEKKVDLVQILEDHMLKQVSLRCEFINVSRTHIPMKYLPK